VTNKKKFSNVDNRVVTAAHCMDFGNVRDFLPRVLVNNPPLKVAGFKELENPCSKH